MLSVLLANGGMTEIGQFLETLQSLANEDTYWETRAQLLVVTATILASDQDGTAEVTAEVKAFALGIISTVFKPTAHSNIKRVGVAYLAPVLSCSPPLMPLYLSVLLSFDRPSDRATLLGLNNMSASFSREATMELPVSGSTGMTYVVHPMNGASVAQGLVDLIQANGGTFFEEHAQVMLGCIVAAEDLGSNVWAEIWDATKMMVVDTLINANACDLAADIIYSLVSQNDSISKSFVEADMLAGLVEDVFSAEGEGKCQEGFVVLASKLANFSVGCCRYIEGLLDRSGSTVDGNDDLRNLRDDLKR